MYFCCCIFIIQLDFDPIHKDMKQFGKLMWKNLLNVVTLTIKVDKTIKRCTWVHDDNFWPNVIQMMT